MELQWIGVAFALGLLARRLQQPPLLGFLAAGFALELLGLRPDESLRELADVGILLLLFAIGVKLDLRSLATRPVLGTASLHMALSVAAFGALLLGGAWLGVPLLDELDVTGALVVAFALSFSSTVFTVKVLEERDDMATFYGRVAIGILIVQDIAAVLFIAASKGEWPSPWALALLGLVPLRPLVGRVLRWCGHDELLVLAGLAAALGGAALFEAVGVKPDLGALAAGVLCGGHEKSRELAKSLFSLKEVFLVGFFLSVGLTGLPTAAMLGVAGLVAALVVLKGLLFLALLLGTRLRARSSLLASAGLATYSEFGLIVVGVASAAGWLSESWAVTIAIAVGLSFLLGSLLNQRVFALYRSLRPRLVRHERPARLPEEEAMEIAWARALVFGMGRIGTPAYDTLCGAMGDIVAGFDVDAARIAEHREAGRRVYAASATDADFWERLEIDRDRVELVLLAMTTLVENRIAIEQLRAEGYRGVIAAAARYEDEIEPLRSAGADHVFPSYAATGAAFAESVLDHAAPGVEGTPTGH